jgi:hypothetical protein
VNIPPRLAKFWAALKPWVLLRLRQPSTYAGVILKLAAISGYVVTDSMAAHLAELLAIVAGALLVAYDEDKVNADPQ